jgi:hypothetical protein
MLKVSRSFLPKYNLQMVWHVDPDGNTYSENCADFIGALLQ